MAEENKETVKPTEQDSISKAEAIAARLEAANKEYAALIERAEKSRITEIFGGKSVAAEKPKTQDELDQEKANVLLSRFK